MPKYSETNEETVINCYTFSIETIEKSNAWIYLWRLTYFITKCTACIFNIYITVDCSVFMDKVATWICLSVHWLIGLCQIILFFLWSLCQFSLYILFWRTLAINIILLYVSSSRLSSFSVILHTNHPLSLYLVEKPQSLISIYFSK